MPRPKPFRRPDGFRTTPRTVSNEPPDSPPTERFSNHPLGQIPDCRPNLFRAPSRRSFRRPFGGMPAPPSGPNPGPLPGGISGRHPGQISGRRTDSEPPSVRTTTRTHRRPGNRTEKRAAFPAAQRAAATALSEQAVQQRRQPVSGFQHLRLGELVRENDEVARLLVRKRLTGLGPVVDHAALAGCCRPASRGACLRRYRVFPASNSGRAGARIPDNATCCSA